MQNETTKNEATKELTFQTMFSVLKKHAIWIGIISLIIAVAVGALTAVLVPVKYVGKTTFWVNNVSEKGDYVQSTMVSASAALAANYTKVVTQKVTLDEAIKEYKLNETLGMSSYETYVYLTKHITTKYEEDSVMFDIYVTDTEQKNVLEISKAIHGVLPEVITSLNTKLAETEKEQEYIKAIEWVSQQEEIQIKSPPVATNTIIALLASFVLLYALVLLLAMLDTIVYDEATLKENFAIPVIGSLPSWDAPGKKRRRRTVLQRMMRRPSYVEADGRVKRNYDDKLLTEQTPFAIQEAFKHLRTNISYSKVTDGTPIYVITSSKPGAGKSTIACNLATTFAVAGKRTLLVETDMRCPVFTSILGIDEEQMGLSELLADIVNDPAEVIVKNYRENLDIITSGHIPPNPSELLGQDRLREYLEKFRGEYDMILMDAPPFGEVVDAGVYASHIDGYLIVARSEHSDIVSVRSTVQSLAALNTPIVGFIMNDVQPKRKKGYGYSYTYYGASVKE